jgi:hypothetical protein
MTIDLNIRGAIACFMGRKQQECHLYGHVAQDKRPLRSVYCAFMSPEYYNIPRCNYDSVVVHDVRLGVVLSDPITAR